MSKLDIHFIDGEPYVPLHQAAQIVVEAQNQLVKAGFAMQDANVAPFTDPRRRYPNEIEKVAVSASVNRTPPLTVGLAGSQIASYLRDHGDSRN